MKAFIKKYYLFGLIIILVILLGLCYYVYTSSRPPKDFWANIEYPNIEVYEEVHFKDLVKASNAEFEDAILDTNEVGDKTLSIKYKYKNRKYNFEYQYTVSDTTAPKIFGSGSKTITLNYDKDLCNLITYADNYDRDLTCNIEGDYDLTKEGSYKIKFIIKDDALNEANHNLTLNVKKSNGNSNNNSSTKKENLSFTDAIKNYKTDALEIGIDVSKWQGDIDFNKVKDAGATFVMMRIGIRSKIGEEISLDSYFTENIKKAKEAGLKVGIYLYSNAMNIDEAKEEANWIVNTLKEEKLDLPICFDWENWTDWNSYHLNFHDLNEMAKTFINTIEEAGYKGMLYSSKFYLENFWFDEDYPNIWLAHYTKKTSYENYDIWQFSNIGTIPGINGDVDLDVMQKEFLN